MENPQHNFRRCTNCNKVLFEAKIVEGWIKHKCDRCGTINIIIAETGDVKPTAPLRFTGKLK